MMNKKHLIQLDMDSFLAREGYLSCTRKGIPSWPYVKLAFLVEPEFLIDQDDVGAEHICILGME